MIVAYGGNNVAIARVFNSFAQFHGVHCTVIGINLEAVIHQVLNAVVQIASVYSTVSIGWVSNVACAGYIVQRCAACHGHDACIRVFGGRGGGGCTVCTLHRGNHITRSHLCARTIRLVVEVAVCVFVHFAAIGFGVNHRGLCILHHLLCIECIGKAAACLFYGQSAACFQCQGVACFNQLFCWCCACGVTTRSSFKAAAVDGIGNIACGYQFAGISTSRNGYFACICACGRCS